MAKGLSRFGWPRGLRRTEAAEYVGISTTKFDQMVADGRMPQPKQIDARRVWDRHKLDSYFDDLPGEQYGANEWDDLLDFGPERPATIPSEKRPRSDALQAWYQQIGFDPGIMSEDELPPLMKAAQERWKASIPGTPFGKRERKALEQLAGYGVGVAVDCNSIKDCGPDTVERLGARGFMETRPRAKYPDRIGFYVLTDAGLQAWKEFITADSE